MKYEGWEIKGEMILLKGRKWVGRRLRGKLKGPINGRWRIGGGKPERERESSKRTGKVYRESKKWERGERRNREGERENRKECEGESWK